MVEHFLRITPIQLGFAAITAQPGQVVEHAGTDFRGSKLRVWTWQGRRILVEPTIIVPDLP
jgi:hypothetical protein